MNTLTEITDTSPIDIEAIRASVLAAINEDGATRRRVADESGVAEGTLGPFLAGKYQGDNERVARQAQRWLDLRADRLEAASVMPAPPMWQETPTARRILSVLSSAQTIGDMSVVGCGPGIGKTVTARKYLAIRPNVFMGSMAPTSRGVSTSLAALLEGMGDANASGTPQALSRRVKEKVRDGRALIIVDEAQNLSVQAFEEFRSIHDSTGCGLVFMGDLRLFNIFGGGRASTFSQLNSRIGGRLEVRKPTHGDVASICSAHGVDDARMIQLCQDIAAKPGALRILTKVLLLARRSAAGLKKPLTPQIITSAWSSLGHDTSRTDSLAAA
jgi:DNA transposition AAA+ family ATPase